MRSTGEPLNDLVSVVVPVYNAALYLDACVNSIINQSYGNIEIILVEDHSTDNSLEMCRKYAQAVFAEFYYVYDNNTRKVEKCIIPEGVYSRAEFALMCLTKLTWEYLSYPCVKIYSKVFLDEHRIRLSEYHDGTFLIDALSYADRVGVLNEPIALYNVREGTISRSLRLNMYEFFSEVRKVQRF